MKTIRFTSACLMMTLGALSSSACVADIGDGIDSEADGPNESIGTVQEALTMPNGSWPQTCWDPRYVYLGDPKKGPPDLFCARCKNARGKYDPAMSCVNLNNTRYPCGLRLPSGAVMGPITNCNGYLICGTSC
jgi:hypothetical protein